ncbi:MAG: T9SS type A sorting domain-containing protein [Balneolales bacterium]
MAQISITRNAFEQSLQTEFELTQHLSTDFENIESLINQDGSDQQWDFTTLEMEDDSLTGTFSIMENPGDLPGGDDSHFEGATHVGVTPIDTVIPDGEDTISAQNIYTYHRLDEDEAITLGTVLVTENEEGEEETSFIYFRPGQVTFEFPVEFENSWDYEYEVENNVADQPFVANFQTGVDIDGWGELITPDGSVDALRIMKTNTLEGGIETVSFEYYDDQGRLVAFITGYNEEFDPNGENVEAGINTYSDDPTSTDREEQLAKSFSLDQNYPNPFNPVTQISYDISEPGEVRLEIYSVLGDRITTLVNQQQGAGSYVVSFNAEQISSGVYMYRLQHNGQVITRMMTLVK